MHCCNSSHSCSITTQLSTIIRCYDIFDFLFFNLYIRILFEIFVLMTLTLQVIAIEVVIGAKVIVAVLVVVVVVNFAAAVVLIVVCRYCLLVN